MPLCNKISLKVHVKLIPDIKACIITFFPSNPYFACTIKLTILCTIFSIKFKCEIMHVQQKIKEREREREREKGRKEGKEILKRL